MNHSITNKLLLAIPLQITLLHRWRPPPYAALQKMSDFLSTTNSKEKITLQKVLTSACSHRIYYRRWRFDSPLRGKESIKNGIKSLGDVVNEKIPR
ncbi:MAG: hypothetical protein LBB21_07010 [Holosporaceae bacterium]|jgi:hypothetical protein|nr:hypothetical protein [Holosporaceae bacterium]